MTFLKHGKTWSLNLTGTRLVRGQLSHTPLLVKRGRMRKQSVLEVFYYCLMLQPLGSEVVSGEQQFRAVELS